MLHIERVYHTPFLFVQIGDVVAPTPPAQEPHLGQATIQLSFSYHQNVTVNEISRVLNKISLTNPIYQHTHVQVYKKIDKKLRVFTKWQYGQITHVI